MKNINYIWVKSVPNHCDNVISKICNKSNNSNESNEIHNLKNELKELKNRIKKIEDESVPY